MNEEDYLSVTDIGPAERAPTLPNGSKTSPIRLFKPHTMDTSDYDGVFPMDNDLSLSKLRRPTFIQVDPPCRMVSFQMYDLDNANLY